MENTPHSWNSGRLSKPPRGRSPPHPTIASSQSSNATAHPQVLDPDYGPQTIHRTDIFFVNTQHMHPRQSNNFSSFPSSPPTHNPLYPYHQQAFQHYQHSQTHQTRPHFPPPSEYAHHVPFQHPNQQIPSSASPPPPLPPKPPVIQYQNISSPIDSYSGPSVTYQPPPPPPLPLSPPPVQSVETVPSLMEDSDELAMVLALSQSESVKRKMLEDQLMDQEEQDLARALAESMLSTGNNLPPPSSNPFFTSPDNFSAASSSRTTLDDLQRKPPSPIKSFDRNAKDPLTSIPPIPLDAPDAPSHINFADLGQYDRRLSLSSGQSEPAQPEVQSPPEDHESAITKGKRPSISKSYSPNSQHEYLDIVKDRRQSAESISSLAYCKSTPPSSASGRGGSFDNYTHPDGVGENDPPPMRTNSPEPLIEPPGSVDSDQILLPTNATLVFDDEAYARQLAAEEEEQARLDQSSLLQTSKDEPIPVHRLNERRSSELPEYWFSGRAESEQQQAPAEPGPSRPVYPAFPSIESLPYNPSSSVSSSSTQPSIPVLHQGISPSTNRPEYPFTLGTLQNHLANSNRTFSGTRPPRRPSSVAQPHLTTRRESQPDMLLEVSSHAAQIPNTTLPVQGMGRPQLHLDTGPPIPGPAAGPSQSARPTNVTTASESKPYNPPLSANAGTLNANHFIDRKLLLGVSIGFFPPTLSARLIPMETAVPNIISLPYDRCPPLHLQAPDWRHLLRLMARLSGTVMEPTVAAMAVSKVDLKLRTVIQFAKPHFAADQWRTILWFTIDQPVSPAVPGASKYTSGNPNLLPWSYTLQRIPKMLENAADTSISKTYTIPATDTVPLPTLPITFPNLVLYLQAVLDNSRKASGDSWNGIGKLAKMVQLCYPSVQEDVAEFDVPERTTVTHLFKRVIGRGGKDKKKGKGTHNEDRYQLVTPFVPDEWG